VGGAFGMLKEDIAASAEFVKNYKEVSGWPVATCEDSLLLEEIFVTATEKSFPGAILPRYSSPVTFYYAVGPTPQIWRELRPLLLSFAGKTVTDFSGIPSILDTSDPTEALLAGLEPYAVARLVPSQETARLALLSLRRFCTILINMQTVKRVRTEPTSLILRNFRCALVASDREEAEECLDRLRRGLRLDALNLRFLEVQLLATFGEWSVLRSKAFFSSLCLTRRSLPVTCALIETLYRTAIAPYEEAGDSEKLLELHRSKIRPISGDLFQFLPPNVPLSVLKVFGLEALSTDPPRQDLTIKLEEIAASEPDGSFSQFWRLVKQDIKVCSDGTTNGLEDALWELIAKPGVPDLQSAKAVLLTVAQLGTLDSYRGASLYLQQLSSFQRDELLGIPWLRELWRSIDNELGWKRIPEDWIEWSQLLAKEEFEEAYAVAEKACEEWPLKRHLNDHSKVKRLANALASVPDGLASERLLDALPLLVDWLRRDLRFPNRSMVLLYETLLTILALNPGRSDSEFAMASLLIDALLSCGLDVPRYTQVLDDVLELARTATGARTLDWILDTMELTVIHPAADTNVRQSFLYGLLDAMMPLATRISRSQAELAKNLGLLLGWQTDKMPAFRELLYKACGDVEGGHQFRRLSGLSIAIHTLTESAGKHISEMLRKLIPEIRIELNHDHVGTPNLKALARNADVFVIVAQSAKHAATDFIRIHRTGKPIIFPKGRGSSSIFRALEEYATQTLKPA
jgi:hypothetical protein